MKYEGIYLNAVYENTVRLKAIVTVKRFWNYGNSTKKNQNLMMDARKNQIGREENELWLVNSYQSG